MDETEVRQAPTTTEASTSSRQDDQIVRRAGELITSNRLQEAMQFLEPELQRAPNAPELNYLMGVAAYRSGDHRTAQTAFERAAQADPHHTDALLGLGLTARQQGQFDIARKAFEIALRSDPENAAARRYLSELSSYAAAAAAQRAVGPGPVAAPAGAAMDDSVAKSLADLLDARTDARPDEVTLAGALVWSGLPAARSLVVSIVGVVVFVPVLMIVVTRFLDALASAIPSGGGRDFFAGLWRLSAALTIPAVVVAVIVVIARWATRRYVLRRHRVETFTGLINRKHQVLWLHDLERPVLVRQNLLQLALGIATVELDSTILPTGRRRRSLGRPGHMLFTGLSIRNAERVASVIRAESLWQRRRMVQNFVSAR